MVEFLTANRDELINRCRVKAKERTSQSMTPQTEEHGVPLFLDQLVEALRVDQHAGRLSSDGIPGSGESPAAAESSRMAAVHGKELLEQGFSVDEVVHGYGDVCQAITELASETNTELPVESFHTFNRLLDNAIANAVTSYECHQNLVSDARNHQQLSLVNRALTAFNAIQRGNIGVKGATAAVLQGSLTELRNLLEKSQA
jgi:hypothetical protein